MRLVTLPWPTLCVPTFKAVGFSVSYLYRPSACTHSVTAQSRGHIALYCTCPTANLQAVAWGHCGSLWLANGGLNGRIMFVIVSTMMLHIRASAKTANRASSLSMG